MKRSISLFLFFCILILPNVISTSSFSRLHLQRYGLSDKIRICENVNPAQPLNSRGQSLVSNLDDPKDIVLCPGDAFGDLTETYVKLEDCYLAMYHRNILIWSSKGSERWRTPSYSYSRHYQCVFSLERDGNLILYKEEKARSNPKAIQYEWDSQTNFSPVKTELKLQGQQVQIIQTFRDGSQRLFYADADHREFIEDRGEPIKKGDKFMIKNHQDEDKTIFRRNEYIGDLNGIHLILQRNCDLQLVNKNKILWSFIPPFRHEMNCTLNIAKDNTIEITSFLNGNIVGSFDQEYDDNFMQGPYQESIMKSEANLEVLQSQITFEDDQSIIIQTLKNGSELMFYGMLGQNSGLNLKRKPTQVALKTIALHNPIEFADYSDDENIFVIKRMDYIGNLTGLHLILGQNCSLILANGNKTLWELENEPGYTDVPLMDCSVKLYSYGEMRLIREFARRYPSWQRLFGHNYLVGDNPGFITGVELTLESDQIIIRLGLENLNPDIWHAGPKTNSAFFQFMAQNSVVISPYDEGILPKKGYIGDLDGVYTILDNGCNWVLYNKTQIIWESGTSWGADEYSSCLVFQTTDRNLMISSSNWSALKISDFTSPLKEAVRTELLLNNSGLWLIYTFRDGAVDKYQAIPGTNHFEPVPKFFVHQDL